MTPDLLDMLSRVRDRGRTKDFQSRLRSFDAPAKVLSLNNTLAVIPVSTIPVVAGARNQRNG